MWAAKDAASKMLYRNVAYVTSLSQSNGERIDIAQDKRHAPTNATRVTAANSCASVAKIPQKQVLTTITNWALKTEAELKSFAFFHQVEGFFVLASCHPKSMIFKKDGSPLGTDFLAMQIAEKDDAAGHFHTWVAGKAIQILNGIRIDTANAKEKALAAILPPGEAGEIARGCSVAANVHTIRKQLRVLISEASGNRLNCAWPGKDCKKKLKEKKLKLCISKNDWNIQKSDLLQPLEKLHQGPALGVLACIQTKKITLTYGEIDSDSSDDNDNDDKEAPSDLEEETQLGNRSLNSGSRDDNTDKSTNSSPSKKCARRTKNASKKKDNTSTKKDSTSKKKSHSSWEKAAAKKKASTIAKKRAHLNQVNRTSKRDGSTNRTDTGSTTRANTSNTNPVPGTSNGNSNMSNIAGEASTALGRGNATEAIPTLDPFLNTLS
ncbi:hypothetical protein PCANC_18037 [Puccinia coronata f. sp. avenae]|uniref:Uncharacterized protein n=1 Tax=Puccinia coronata f. sp. avenae TaxID=200324 RepID=A0A2N5SS09_9BASI|nr:hypothetical protein PCANC_18037 [Puccinia coronata f. sp. avenae]